MEFNYLINCLSWILSIIFIMSLILSGMNKKILQIIGFILWGISYVFWILFCFKMKMESISFVFLIHLIVPINGFILLFKKKKED